MAGPGDLLGSVIRGTLGRERTEIATEIKRGAQGVIGQATGGLVGTPQTNDGASNIGGVQRRPTAQEAAAQGPATAASGVNSMTQNVLNRFGQGSPQTPTLGQTVESIPGRILGAILPSQATVDRLTGGARAVQATVADPASLVRGRVERQAPAPVEDRSTYSAAAIAEARAAGRDTRNMRQTPADPAAVTATAPAAAPAAAPPERSFWQRLTGAASSATAAVATAVTVATTPAAAAPEAPTKPTITAAVSTSPASSTAQPVVLITAEEHAAELAAQAAATPATAPASTVAAGPAVTTTVAPTTQFSAAAAPVAATPAKPFANLDSMIENERDAARLETLTRARAQVAKIEPGGPGMG